MDSGPEPMRDMKSAQKVENSVDKFDEHHAEYEARGQPSCDRIQMVQDHCKMYPKLEKELQKRHSAKAITINNRTKKPASRIEIQPKCSACIKLKEMLRLQSLKLRPRCRSRVRKRVKSSRRNSKSKRRIRFADRRKSYGIKHKGSQCYNMPIRNKNIGNVLNSKMARNFDGICNAKELNITQPNETTGNKNSKECLSGGSSGYPDTSIPSVSSYHTYASMENEPMVEE